MAPSMPKSKLVSGDGNAPASSSGGCVSLGFTKLGTGKMKERNTQLAAKAIIKRW